MILKDDEIFVNMPNCENLLFTFENEKIIKMKRIPLSKSKGSKGFYNLTNEMKEKINNFLNSTAI